jgi:archaellum biogenesis ATPase FlaH
VADRKELVADYIERGWVPFAYEGMFTPPKGWQRSVVQEDTLSRIVNTDTPVAVLTGKVSGLLVVDLDGRNGADVKAFLEHYRLGPRSTRVHKSASPGSYHILFKWPERLESLPKTKGERTGVPALTGTDLLADGAHIFAPPTVRVGHPEKPDGAYELLVDVPLIEPPEALLVDWQSAVTRQTPEGKAVGQINPNDYDTVLKLHQRNIEIAAEAVQGSRDDVCVARIGSSIRIALAMPDVVLSTERVKSDFENGVPYEIKDLAGKIERAVEWAEQHQWKELTQQSELPDGVPPDKANDFFEELSRLRLKAAAKRAFDLEELERQTAIVDIGAVVNATELLKRPRTNPRWVVDGLINHGASALLTGKYKAGKSTLMLNLIKALTTGGEFLGKFQVPGPMRVAYVDMELGEDMAQRWIREVSGIDTDLLEYIDRRGQGYKLNMQSESLRSKWVRMLMEREVDVLIIDPLSPIMSALGVEENSSQTVRPMLDAFDTLAVEANLKAIVVTHHTGHQDANRARGSTAFMDWAGSFMSVVRQGEEYDSPRYFRASGRDVALNATELTFHPEHRELRLAGPVDIDFGGDDNEDKPW